MDQDTNNQHGEKPHFGVPKNYFAESASELIHKLEWLEENKNYPQLSKNRENWGQASIFNVPAGYFQSLGSSAELLPYSNLRSLKGKAPFSVPAGYFEELSFNLIPENENSEITLLKGITKENNFSTPVNYFADNKDSLVKKLSVSTSARVISIWRKPLQYAAAAVLTLVLGLWLYSYYFGPQQKEDCGTIACVDRNELLDGKNLENLDDTELYELVNTKKLQKSLDHDQPAKSGNADSSDNLSSDDLLDEI